MSHVALGEKSLPTPDLATHEVHSCTLGIEQFLRGSLVFWVGFHQPLCHIPQLVTIIEGIFERKPNFLETTSYASSLFWKTVTK